MTVPPNISVVIEGYNEQRSLGIADDTVAALKAQIFPLDKVELILVGDREQAEHWRRQYLHDPVFHSVHAVACDGHYAELKNRGAEAATGAIIAFTDADVLPRQGWLSSIAENIGVRGADVSLGPSMFGEPGRHDPESMLMQICASMTWGWVFGPRGADKRPIARGFMGHNLAMRAEVAREFRYPTKFGRVIATSVMFRRLSDQGRRILIHSRQQAVHSFSFRYWAISLQFRYGYEVYRVRRLDEKYPARWMRKAGLLEPLLNLGWHVALDIPRWFRFRRAIDCPLWGTLAGLPMLIAVSVVARSFEAAGMYATIFRPEPTRKWAENV